MPSSFFILAALFWTTFDFCCGVLFGYFACSFGMLIFMSIVKAFWMLGVRSNEVGGIEFNIAYFCNDF